VTKRSVALLLMLMAMTLAGLSVVASAVGADNLQASQISAARVKGIWTVTKVSTDPHAAVAALLDDDPAYINATVTFSSDAMTWNSSKTNGKGNYDSCKGPTYSASPDDPGFYEIKCSGDSSDFHPTVKAFNRDTLILKWYDGGILTLTRKQ
jgi:hypothetical protein